VKETLFLCHTAHNKKPTWTSLRLKPGLRGESTEENVLRRGRNVTGGWENITLYGTSQFVLTTEYYYNNRHPKPVFLNRRAAAGYRALTSIITGCERPGKTTICYKISLFQLITNLNIILYLSTCHIVYISVLILFVII
jgi:hypothetical protein